MSDFNKAYDEMMRLEGGYKLHRNATETGDTYAGIYRTAHPKWPGWAFIDRGQTPPTQLVRDFYMVEFWLPCACDKIDANNVAESVFNFAVNTHPKTAVKLAQIVVGAAPDGVPGPKTVAAINAFDPVLFDALFALAKIKRYAEICNKNRSKSQFLLGWLNRTFEVLESK